MSHIELDPNFEPNPPSESRRGFVRLATGTIVGAAGGAFGADLLSRRQFTAEDVRQAVEAARQAGYAEGRSAEMWAASHAALDATRLTLQMNRFANRGSVICRPVLAATITVNNGVCCKGDLVVWKNLSVRPVQLHGGTPGWLGRAHIDHNGQPVTTPFKMLPSMPIVFDEGYGPDNPYRMADIEVRSHRVDNFDGHRIIMTDPETGQSLTEIVN